MAYIWKQIKKFNGKKLIMIKNIKTSPLNFMIEYDYSNYDWFATYSNKKIWSYNDKIDLTKKEIETFKEVAKRYLI